jgi:hypothetical protein
MLGVPLLPTSLDVPAATSRPLQSWAMQSSARCRLAAAHSAGVRSGTRSPRVRSHCRFR